MRIGLGLGLGNQQTVSVESYAAEAQAYFTAIPNNTYSVAEKNDINTMIVSLIASGVWEKLDQLYLLCCKTATEAESRVNLIYPTAAANATASADPRRAMSKITSGGAQLVFTSGSGYVTTSAAEKLSGNYIPDGTYQFKRNNSHVMVYLGNNVDTGKTEGIAIGGSVSKYMNYFIPRNAINTAIARFGKTTTLSIGENTTKGLYILNRNPSESQTFRIIKDGSVIATQTSSDQALPSKAFGIFGYIDYATGTSFYDGIIGVYGIGGGLTDAEYGAYTTAINTFLSALGAK
jgi:hypothetical protein